MGDAASESADAAGCAGGRSSPGRRGRPGADSFQAEGKRLNPLTFELPGTLFTLAARVAVLQILNTDLGASGVPSCALSPGASRAPQRPRLGGQWGPRPVPPLQTAVCIGCWGNAQGDLFSFAPPG